MSVRYGIASDTGSSPGLGTTPVSGALMQVAPASDGTPAGALIANGGRPMDSVGPTPDPLKRHNGHAAPDLGGWNSGPAQPYGPANLAAAVGRMLEANGVKVADETPRIHDERLWAASVLLACFTQDLVMQPGRTCHCRDETEREVGKTGAVGPWLHVNGSEMCTPRAFGTTATPCAGGPS